MARKGRSRLSLERIVAAAVAIADTEGLEAVSIRRVAAELESPPMTLYGHIANKEDLLDHMRDAAVKEMLATGPIPSDWRQAVTEIARRIYLVYISRPWSVQLLTQRASFGENGAELAKQMAKATEGLPLDESERWAIIATMNDFVLGHAIRDVSRPGRLADSLSRSELGDIPELRSLPESIREHETIARFELGLDIFFDGVERRFLDR